MIEPMKKVFLIVQTYNKSDMLRTLRKVGLVHVIDTGTPKSEQGDALAKQGENLELIASTLAENADKKNPAVQKELSAEEFKAWETKSLEAIAKRKELKELLVRDEREISRVRSWGAFNPEEVSDLASDGINLSFFTIGAKELALLSSDVRYILLSPIDGQQSIAVLDGNGSLPGATRFDLPAESLGALEKEYKETEGKIAEIEAFLKASVCYADRVAKEQKRNVQDQTFMKISDGMGGDVELCYLLGYLPTKSMEKFEKTAKANSWGYQLEDPEDEDNPPTELRLKKGIDMMKPIYSILGTLPGYRERDISLWFLMFFTLFFAMIIGDAGYGMVFLAIAIALHVKTKDASPTVRLIYVLSGATIVWGALTGTWFGSKVILEHLTFLQKLVIPQISNIPELFNVTSKVTQDTLMNFCFILGTVQLSLACVLNIIYKAKRKNISLLADVGWFMDIIALYNVILMLVFSKEIDVTLAFGTVGVGFALVLVFGNQAPGKKFGDGLKEGLAGVLPTFLNTISCFSNTMSYIRLFAVGMAGYAIASSFNSMAESVLGIRIVGVIGFLFIVLIGHALNLVMGILSVIVHGVRLNILEFSNQLGMEWSGYAYDPFRETVKE